jgi:hypothetical protein
MPTQPPARLVTELDRARFTIFATGHYLAVWGLAFAAGLLMDDSTPRLMSDALREAP